MDKFFSPTNSMSDNDIIAQIKGGDRNYLKVLINRYMPYIINAVRNYPASMREDLIQEGSLAVFTAAKTFDSEKSTFSTFVFLCINRAVATAAKAGEAKKRIPENLIDSIEDVDILSPLDPEKMLIERENFENLKSNIKKNLSETEYRILGEYLSGKSYGEIAAGLSISEKAVDNALLRARNKLKKL